MLGLFSVNFFWLYYIKFLFSNFCYCILFFFAIDHSELISLEMHIMWNNIKQATKKANEREKVPPIFLKIIHISLVEI